MGAVTDDLGRTAVSAEDVSYAYSEGSRALDRVHFRLGLAYALAGNSTQNLRECRAHLQRVASRFPDSQYKIPAEFILSLQAEIEKLSGDLKEQQAKMKNLSEELQKLKAIDMQRQPSRPPK